MKRTSLISLNIALAIAIFAGVVLGRGLASRSDAAAVVAVEAPTHVSIPTPQPDVATVEIGSFHIVEEPVGVEPINPEEPAELEVGVHLDVLGFVEDFNDAHENADLAFLEATLHPDVSSSFGADTCAAYVEATMGSISDMSVNEVHPPKTYRLPTPDGDLVFENSIPVTAEWTIVHTGEVQTVEFHVMPANDSGLWLTTCGWNANQ